MPTRTGWLACWPEPPMDLRKGLLAVADRLEGLASRLPEPLRRPLLAEFRPLKELFLVRRAPRLLLVGATGEEAARLVRLVVGDDLRIRAWDEHPGWLIRQSDGEGEQGVGVLPVGIDQPGLVRDALENAKPDAVVVLAPQAGLAATLEAVAQFLADPRPDAVLVERCHVVVADHALSALSGDRILQAQSVLRHSVGKVLLWGGEAIDPPSNGEFLEKLCDGLPAECRLAFVRSADVPAARRRLARSVVRSITAVSAAVGAQPIPLADLPVLASLQALMVAAVMDISGRRADLRSASEFLASIGVNLGVAFVLREGARAVVKVVPGFGNAVSGGVAAAGTYAMGRAAIAYFIEGVDLAGARSVLRLGRRRKSPGKALPGPRGPGSDPL